MLYEPGVLAATLITPVELLIDNPAVELKVPPLVKPEFNMGDWLPALVHIGVL